MSNVARNTVSPSWFATPIPRSSVKSSRITSRISVSTINTDLFPELITWAAVIEDNSPASCSQKVPIDVLSKREHDIDTVNETPVHSISLALVLDPTSLEFGFDRSCLDGLDDCLAYSPIDAFKETCWMQGTHSSPLQEAKARPPKRSITPRPRRRPVPLSPLAARGAFEDDSESDSDDTATLTDDDHRVDLTDNDLLNLNSTGRSLTHDDEKSLYYGDEKTSFIFFDPSPFPVREQNESVGSFPIPTLPRKSAPSRLAAFCANIPGSLTFVR